MTKQHNPDAGFQTIVYRKQYALWLRRMPAPMRLKIHDALDAYIIDGTEPDDTDLTYTVFPSILEQIKEDKAKYDKRRETNRQNGLQRWNKERTDYAPPVMRSDAIAPDECE